MPSFGKVSLEKLDTCHPDIIVIMNEVIKYYDFTILEGVRTAEQQMKYFTQGFSKLDGVIKKSKHQNVPSLAIDIAPYPVDFSQDSKSIARFYYLAGYVMGIAEKLYDEGKIKSKIKWGGDWDGDKLFSDNFFDDLPHFQIKK